MKKRSRGVIDSNLPYVILLSSIGYKFAGSQEYLLIIRVCVVQVDWFC